MGGEPDLEDAPKEHVNRAGRRHCDDPGGGSLDERRLGDPGVFRSITRTTPGKTGGYRIWAFRKREGHKCLQ